MLGITSLKDLRERDSGTHSAKTITLAVLLVASLNLGWQFHRMHQQDIERQKLFEQHGFTVCSFGPAADESSRMYIEILLIIAFVGSRLKGFMSTLLSVVGLSGSSIVYISWWQYFFRIAEASESEMTFVKHIAYLYRATVLDLVIAAAIALLIVLHLRYAVSLFREQPQEFDGSMID